MSKQNNKEYQLIFLFGKDVFSIIKNYDPDGFDLWDQQMKKIIKEYHKKLYWKDTISHKGFVASNLYTRSGLINWRNHVNLSQHEVSIHWIDFKLDNPISYWMGVHMNPNQKLYA